MKRISEIFITLCFLGFLAVGLALTVSHAPESYSYYENRSLASFPELSAQSAGDGSLTTGIERYLDDQAAMRTASLKAKARIDLALHRPVVNEVVVTKERLLPYLSNASGIVDAATVADKAERMADNLKRINDTVTGYGGYYCYVGVPCQYAYFEDDYPWYLCNRKELSLAAASSLAQAMAQRGVPFLDIRAAFDAMGHPEEYGSRVDNHYTMEGAFATYRLVMEKVAAESGLEFPILGPEDVRFETLPNEYMGSRERKLLNMETRAEALSILRPLEDVPFTRSNNGNPAASVVYAMPASDAEELTYGLYMGGDIAHTIIETHRDDLPSILIYGDSFTNAMECVAYLSFDEMHSLDLRHYHEMSLEDYIRELQPEVVVCIRDYEALLAESGNGGAID